MKFMALASAGLLCSALVCGIVFKAYEPPADESCNLLIEFLAEDIQDIPISSCKTPSGSQTVVEVALTVPASRVLDVQRILISSYGMEPLRFVCCGYETLSVTIALPANHPLRKDMPSGVFRDISLSFYAPGLSDDDDSNEFLGLGQADADLRLELVDY